MYIEVEAIMFIIPVPQYLTNEKTFSYHSPSLGLEKAKTNRMGKSGGCCVINDFSFPLTDVYSLRRHPIYVKCLALASCMQA
jgi:hypothetical protein